TFKLPDLRGRSSIGAGTGTGLSARTLGTTGGAETHVLTVAELAAHNHTTVDPPDNGSVWTWATVLKQGLGSPILSGSRGGNAPHNNMPPFAVTKNCIKY